MPNKVIYIHPAIRKYRVHIFQKLHRELNVDFFWSGRPKVTSHVSQEIDDILQNTDISYIQANEIHSLPFDNFSFELLKLPFQKYKVYIFSNITSVPFLLLAPILKILGKRIVVFDELWRYPIEVRKYRVIYPYVKFIAKTCINGVIAAGSKTKELYISTFNMHESKILIAYNTTIDNSKLTLDNTENQNINNIITQTTTKKKLLYLGRIVEYKGLDVLIKAMPKVSTKYDLIVVGDGDHISYCKNLVMTLGLDKRVYFLGPCSSSQTYYYYYNCDIFVLPTKFCYADNVQTESWGFTVNEAMSHAIPVVATTAVGSGFDLIIPRKTGALALAGDVNDLARCINQVIDLNINNVLGINAKNNLAFRCNYEQNFLVYKEMLKRLL